MSGFYSSRTKAFNLTLNEPMPIISGGDSTKKYSFAIANYGANPIYLRFDRKVEVRDAWIINQNNIHFFDDFVVDSGDTLYGFTINANQTNPNNTRLINWKGKD